MEDYYISYKSVVDILTKNRVHFDDMVKITSELKELPSITPQSVVDDIRTEIKQTYNDIDDVLIKNGLSLAMKTIDKHTK